MQLKDIERNTSSAKHTHTQQHLHHKQPLSHPPPPSPIPIPLSSLSFSLTSLARSLAQRRALSPLKKRAIKKKRSFRIPSHSLTFIRALLLALLANAEAPLFFFALTLLPAVLLALLDIVRTTFDLIEELQ